MPDRNQMAVPGTQVNAMNPDQDNRTLMQRYAPNFRDYVPKWFADVGAEALRYPLMLGRAGMAAPIMSAAGARMGSMPLPPPELNASSLATETGMRPADLGVKYPDPTNLQRVLPSRAANGLDNTITRQLQREDPTLSDEAFNNWAMQFLRQYELEQSKPPFREGRQIDTDPRVQAEIDRQWNDMARKGRQPDLTLIPGGKKD